MSSTSFSRFATVTASTKRPPAVAGAKRGQPVTNLASVSVTPLMPADLRPEVAQELATRKPYELLMCGIDGDADVVEGDVLVIGSNEYDVRSVGDWPWDTSGAGAYKTLYVEEKKQG